MTTNETFDPEKLVNNPQGRVADLHGFSLNLGGQNGVAGKGGSGEAAAHDHLGGRRRWDGLRIGEVAASVRQAANGRKGERVIRGCQRV